MKAKAATLMRSRCPSRHLEGRHPNAAREPYASDVQLSHSSTLRTMQELFDVDPQAGYPWLGAAATANDLSDLFKPGAIR